MSSDKQRKRRWMNNFVESEESESDHCKRELLEFTRGSGASDSVMPRAFSKTTFHPGISRWPKRRSLHCSNRRHCQRHIKGRTTNDIKNITVQVADVHTPVCYDQGVQRWTKNHVR